MDYEVEGVLDLGKQDAAFNLTPRTQSPTDYHILRNVEDQSSSPRHSSAPIDSPRSSTKSSPRSPRMAPTPEKIVLIPKPSMTRATLKHEQINKIRYGTVPQRIVRPMKDHPVYLNIKTIEKPKPEPKEEPTPEPIAEDIFVDTSPDALDALQILQRMQLFGSVRQGEWKLDKGVITYEDFGKKPEVCDIESQSEGEYVLKAEVIDTEMQCEEYVHNNEELLDQIEAMAQQINLLTEQIKSERMKHSREINFMDERYDALLQQLSMKAEVTSTHTNTELDVRNSSTNTELDISNVGINTEIEVSHKCINTMSHELLTTVAVNTEPPNNKTVATDTSTLITVKNQSVETLVITNSRAINTDGGLYRNNSTSTSDLIRTNSVGTSCENQEPVRLYTPPMPTEITPPSVSPIPYMSPDFSNLERTFYANLMPRSPPPAPLLGRPQANYSPATHTSPIRYHSPSKIRSPSPTNQYQEPGRNKPNYEEDAPKVLNFSLPLERTTSPPRMPKPNHVSFADISAPLIEEKPKKIKKVKKKVKTKEEKEAIALEKAKKAERKLEKYTELQNEVDRTLIEKTLRKKPEKEKKPDGVYFVYVDPQTKVLMPESAALIESKKLKSKGS